MRVPGYTVSSSVRIPPNGVTVAHTNFSRRFVFSARHTTHRWPTQAPTTDRFLREGDGARIRSGDDDGFRGFARLPMRTADRSFFSRALVSLHVLVLVRRAHAAVDGRAGRSPVLLLGGGDVDVGTLTRCRLEAHESVFDSETLADLDRAAPGAGDAPPDMCARPQLACRVASVASRCRLARGGARSRGACDVARDCERCVLDALGRDEGDGAAKTNEDPPSSPDPRLPSRRVSPVLPEREHAFIDRAMEWSVYQQELAAVDAECRHVEARWRAETTARTLARVVAAAEAAEREAAKSRVASSRAAKTVVAAVDAAAAAATALTERLATLERSAEDVSRRVVRAGEDARRHEEEEARRHAAATIRATKIAADATTAAEDASRALDAAKKLAAIGDAARERLETIADGVARIVGERTRLSFRALCARIVACVAAANVARSVGRALVERRVAARTMTWRASTDERLVALAHSLDDLRANLDAGSLFEPRPGLSRAARRRRRDVSAATGSTTKTRTRARTTTTRG